MTDQLHCHGCGHRFGKRSQSILLVGNFLLCQPCADSPKVHSRLFWGCEAPHTTPRPHGDLVTYGRARQALQPQTPTKEAS